MDPQSLVQALMGLFRKPQQPAQQPGLAVDELRPWDSPVLQHPSMQQIPADLMKGPGLVPTQPGPVTSSDDALVQALLRKRLNQEFAKAGNQPIPR